MSGKNYKAAQEKMGNEPLVIGAAVALLKEHVKGKFDQTVEIHMNLGVDVSKSDQSVRGSVVLPHGTPKPKRVVVLTNDSAKRKEASEAGAVQVGSDDIIDAILKTGDIDADVIVATPDMMPKIAKAAKTLGPKGLMPNPKTGTVTPDVAAAVRELMGGKVSFKMDQTGNIHEAVGKVSWEASQIAENAQAVVAAVRSARPSSQKGEFIRKVVLKSTMSPAIRILV